MEGFDPQQKLRSDLKDFSSYSAHTSPDFMKKKFGLNIEEVIKLDANENPYGCSGQVVNSLKDGGPFSVYPDAAQSELRSELSLYTSMPSDCIACGAGSDQLIDLIIRLTINPGDEIIILPPTFGMYAFYAKLSRARIIEVGRDENFCFNCDDVLNRITPRTRIIFLANPNNPTGNLVLKTDIQALLDTGIIVVVDEAYYEFSRETVVPWVERYDNLIVLRTFSKWAGLAGLRVGYGIFPQYIAEYIMRIKDPYAINVCAQNAAIASLRDKDNLLQKVESIVYERERLFGRLCALEGLTPFPSKANFILCRLHNGRAFRLTEHLKEWGILVRYFNTPALKDYFRISVGRPEQNDIVVERIREILGEDTQW